MDWKTFWIALLTSSGLHAVAMMIFTAWINAKIEKDVAKYKGVLDKELATHNAELQRNTAVFENVKQAITEAYKLLVRYRESVHIFMSTAPSEGDPYGNTLFNAAHEKRKDFDRYFDLNKFYVPSPIDKRMESLSKMIMFCALTYHSAREMKGTPEAKQHYDENFEACKKMNEMFQQLDVELQNHLGIQKPK